MVVWWQRLHFVFLLALGINPSLEQETRSSDDLHHTHTHRQTQHTLHTGAERPFVTVNNVRTPLHRLNNLPPFLP